MRWLLLAALVAFPWPTPPGSADLQVPGARASRSALTAKPHPDPERTWRSALPPDHQARASAGGLGLDLRLATLGSPKLEDHRHARLVALHVPAGAPASPFLPARRFTATWRGFLNLDLRTRLTFSARGRGKVKLTVRGKVLLEGEADDLSTLGSKAARVRKGENPFVLEYTAPESGDATVRLLWQGRDFQIEPVPTTVFTRGSTAESRDRSAARVSFARHRCIKCHRPETPLPATGRVRNAGNASCDPASAVIHWSLKTSAARPATLNGPGV